MKIRFCATWMPKYTIYWCTLYVLSDNQCILWSTCCFLSCSVCSSFATLSFWPFLPIDPRYKVKPSDGHGSRMISIRHRPGTWPAKKKWMRPIPQWLHEPGGDTIGMGAKRARPKVFMWASWFPWLSFSMFCLWEWTHQKIHPLLGHFFVNSCALKFTLCLSPPAFLIYSTLSTE